MPLSISFSCRNTGSLGGEYSLARGTNCFVSLSFFISNDLASVALSSKQSGTRLAVTKPFLSRILLCGDILRFYNAIVAASWRECFLLWLRFIRRLSLSV